MKFSTVFGASSGKNSILMMPPFSMVISAVCFTRAVPFDSAGLEAWAHAPDGTTSATMRAASSIRIFTYELLLEGEVGGHYARRDGPGQGRRSAASENSVLQWGHARAQRHPQRRHHRARRPREDHPGRRHALAVGHLPRQRARGRAGHGLDRPG